MHLAQNNYKTKTFEHKQKWSYRFKGETEPRGTFFQKFLLKYSTKKCAFKTSKEDTDILFTPCEREAKSGIMIIYECHRVKMEYSSEVMNFKID